MTIAPNKRKIEITLFFAITLAIFSACTQIQVLDADTKQPINDAQITIIMGRDVRKFKTGTIEWGKFRYKGSVSIGEEFPLYGKVFFLVRKKGYYPLWIRVRVTRGENECPSLLFGSLFRENKTCFLLTFALSKENSRNRNQYNDLPVVAYHMNGNKAIVAHVGPNGNLHGKASVWDRDGNLVRKVDFENGKLKSVSHGAVTRIRVSYQIEGIDQQKEVEHITKIAEEIMPGIKVTSTYRDDSENHKRGAVDFGTKNLTETERHEKARKLSERLGSNYTVIVEEINPSNKKQTDTAYKNGIKGNVRIKEKKATATHTHAHRDKPKTPDASVTPTPTHGNNAAAPPSNRSTTPATNPPEPRSRRSRIQRRSRRSRIQRRSRRSRIQRRSRRSQIRR